MAQAKSLSDLMRIRAKNREFLDSINGNLGTALGFKKPTGQEVTNEPAIIVFVPRKINPKWIPGAQQIPKKLKGPNNLWCPVDVVEGGQAEPDEVIEVPRSESELAERLRGWDEQVWVGSQVAHWTNRSEGLYSVGTLGGFARRRSDDANGFITNQHVAVRSGQKIFHPVPWGTHIGTTKEVVELVADEKWYGQFIDEPNTWVRADCAFVELESSFPQGDINTHMMGVGPLGNVQEISLDDMSIIGQNVLRVGRTTGLRRGRVVAFGYEFRDEADATAYTDLLIMGQNDIPFSTHGDSGSLIVTDDAEHRPVGLLWGGWQERLRSGHAQENWTYGIALTRVLETLDVDLHTG